MRDHTLMQMLRMEIASCTCATKTPEHQYHDANCHYRHISEARKAIASVWYTFSEVVAGTTITIKLGCGSTLVGCEVDEHLVVTWGLINVMSIPSFDPTTTKWK